MQPFTFALFFASWGFFYMLDTLELFLRFKSFLLKFILMSHCVYPKTAGFKEKDNLALYERDDLDIN